MSLRLMLKSLIHTATLKFRKNEVEPHSKVFSEIYANRVWGGSRAQQLDFCSGLGSFPDNSSDYEDVVVQFIKDNDIASIVDVGCGDFQVSQRILEKIGKSLRYIGVDVVPDLIERNNRLFANEFVSFQVADAVTDPLPSGDLLITREVLQHLSNESVQAVLEKVKSFPFALITNGVAQNPIRKNIDIVAGSSTRVSLGSGLWLERSPFNFPCSELFNMPHSGGGADLRTVSYRR